MFLPTYIEGQQIYIHNNSNIPIYIRTENNTYSNVISPTNGLSNTNYILAIGCYVLYYCTYDSAYDGDYVWVPFMSYINTSIFGIQYTGTLNANASNSVSRVEIYTGSDHYDYFSLDAGVYIITILAGNGNSGFGNPQYTIGLNKNTIAFDSTGANTNTCIIGENNGYYGGSKAGGTFVYTQQLSSDILYIVHSTDYETGSITTFGTYSYIRIF